MPTPHVLFGDDARDRLKEGIDLLARLVSLTLGPRAGLVTSARSAKRPEPLTSSAVIARRIVEVQGRGRNVGTMMLRHALWTQHQQLGDGGATMAALTHALLQGGHRQLAAGANAMLLRRGMERGLRAAEAAMRAQARPLDGERHLAGMALAATADAELSASLGEIFHRLGPEATVTIEEYAATYMAHRILDGAAWPGGFVSPFFIGDEASRQTRQIAPRVLVTDHTIDDPAQLIPLLERFVRAGGGPLLIVADDVTGQARAMLLANRQRGLLDVAAAKLEAGGTQRHAQLGDIAAATDAYFFEKGRGDRLETAEVSELGRARVTQVEPSKITVVGGAGAGGMAEARRRQLRGELARAADEDERRKLVERLGRLAGGMAVLKIGAASNTERTVRKELAERFMRFVPQAVEEGVVPGGGAAFLACQPALAELAGAGDELAAGAALVRDALAAPMTWLAHSAGLTPAVALDGARRAGPSWGYDVVGEQLVDMWEANILDAAKVARCSLQTAVSIASMALTTDVIVLKRRPVVATEP